MKAIVYDRPREWELRDVATPEPGAGEVRVDVTAAGLCGTDLHLHVGEFGPVYPLTPGHEMAGTVAAVGDGVTEVAVGDAVAVDNMMACGSCVQCRRARPQFCRFMRALGITEPGGFAESVVVPAGKCHPADGLPAEMAVFAEPIACVVHGLDVLALHPGSDVLVFGTGPTGLILSQLLATSGAGRVTVAGRTPFKLDIAAEYGADETVLLGDPDDDDRRLAALAPDGFDAVVDATGSVDILARCLALTGIGGTLFVYGMTAEAAVLNISPYDVFRRELRIAGSFAQAYSFARAMGLLRTGRVRTDLMVTHRFDLGGYADAIDAVANDRACLKALIRP